MLQPRVLVVALPTVCFFLNLCPLPADGQARGRGVEGIGGGAERIQVMFTPSICKMRCSHSRCVNLCERGNVTTLYNSQTGGERDNSHRPGFRVSPSSPMVKVRVQHPPAASVKVHQVLKLSGYSPTLHAHTSSSQSGTLKQSAGAPAPAGSRVQAQTVRGDGTYTQHSEFKYCFRAVKDGQCSSPLPGLRSKDTCCRGLGKAWGISDCVLCPPDKGQGNSSCPAGFDSISGTQCVDVNECLQPGLCENGICVNTRGSYSCVCRAGYILDASHGICISQSVISEEKNQCYRVLGSGIGPASCSLPILRNITKQICCCSRVGKAWGPNCQRCPYFGSVAFKEICPAGPGYHYSASALQFSQRAAQQLEAGGPRLVTGDKTQSSNSGSTSQTSNEGTWSQQQSSGSGKTSSGSGSTSKSSTSSQTKLSLPSSGPSQSGQSKPPTSVGSSPNQPHQPGSAGTTQIKKIAPGQAGSPQTPHTRPATGGIIIKQPRLPPLSTGGQVGRGKSLLVLAQPEAAAPLPTPLIKANATSTPRPTSVHHTLGGVCKTRPGVCGRGRCVDQPGGRHTCLCDQGYRPNSQHTYCQDVNECVQSPGLCQVGECVNMVGSYRCVCPSGYRSNTQQTTCQDIDECKQSPCINGHCENTPGSFECVCLLGYRLQGNSCTDVNECGDPLQCPGQECVNSPGSYRCVSCQPGYGLLNGLCTDINECDAGGVCVGQECVNTEGSYSCVNCKEGFHSTNGQCTDIDECQQSPCHNGHCENTAGSFTCVCPLGHQLEGNICTDVNECLEGEFCFPRGECVNTPGSYLCVCAQGYTPSTNGTTCIDVNECAGQDVCHHGNCVNTEGSFLCECQTGFTTSPEKTACLDINECANKTVCGPHAFCQNLIGTYQCVCDQGYTSTRDSKACVDEDECVSMQGVCGAAHCENVEGSFMCECHREGEEFDTRTGQCISTTQQGGSAPPETSSSHIFPSSVGASLQPPLPAARPGELRECYYNLADSATCNLLATNTSQQECCCTLGEAWGLGCQYDPCPAHHTAEFLSLCPSGRGYVTSGAGAFSYRDVDECKRFHPEVCKSGACVNNIPGYTCYCNSGYVYDSALLECVDYDECEAEESCPGGLCVNTVGSYYCSCQPPLVLDDTQRNCVNSSDLTLDENLSFCWQTVTADLVCQSPLMGGQVTFIDCCCLYGAGWGLDCALCPATDSEGYANLCSSILPPPFADPYRPEPGLALRPDSRGRGGTGPPFGAPYGSDSFPVAVAPARDYGGSDYDDYTPAGGRRPGFAGRTPGTYRRPGYGAGSYYDEGDYGPLDSSPPRTPSFRLPADPRSERAFGVRPPPPSQPEGLPLSLAPLPGGGPYTREEEEEEEEGEWRAVPPFPPFSDRRGGPLQRVYERPYDSFAGLSAAEDCGILHGCENGRCIRVSEGYTCDCYPGYQLDMTSMTCRDVNECEDPHGIEYECVNARCVNTDGSFRCVCRRGYIMSHRPNHCVAA